ncbi:DUF3179 domain-containing protein [Granulosicoccus sp.]|nr:DUF3179 domain-containing protein [Granulosicoccus sp.]
MHFVYGLARQLRRIIKISVLGCLLSISGLAAAQVLQFPQGEFPLTDYKKSSVTIDEILTGGPPRDGIPAIDAPVFVDANSAAAWLQDQEPVIALVVNEVARAYPLQILMYHEIVNDVIAGVPVAVTFCPLCNASIVFEREVVQGAGKTLLDFGTTGRLRKSDLLMYDRQTESWWQQFTGRGVIGEFVDTELVRRSSQIISFGEFRAAFPEAQILSRETGFSRPYGNNPYRGYDAIDNNPFLFRGDIDPRLPAMERVLSIRSDSETQLIALGQLVDIPLAHLDIDERSIVVFAASVASSALDAGKISESRTVPSAAAYLAKVGDENLTFKLTDGAIVDEQTGSLWNAFGRSTQGKLSGVQLEQLDDGVHFAFAWLAFDPEAKVIKLE